MISVITASYNYENFIKETIESVLSQTYSDWELIIVDDGSKDNSLKIIEEYCQKDNRIHLYTHENNVNKGLSETLKLGISKAKGDYIAFLESDDTWNENALKNKAKAIEEYPQASVYINDLNLIGEENSIREFENSHKKYFEEQREFLLQEKFDIKEFMNNNWFPTFSCMAVKKEYLEKADFDTPSKPNLDWFLWVQVLLENSEVVYIPFKDTNWRIHGGSYISSRNKNDYSAFFGKIHEMLFKKDLPNLEYNFSSFLHEPKIGKICRKVVRNFDKKIILKYPHTVNIKRLRMIESPVLSVCIPTYKKGDYLYKMIAEFLKTDNQDFEIVVSDNFSNDGSAEKLEALNDNRLRVIKNNDNKGSYINGLTAMENACGKYIMLLMDKDFICSDNINQITKILSEENFYTGYFKLDYEDDKIYTEKFCKKVDCIKQFAYGTRHPSGFLFNNEIFKQKNLAAKYKEADDIIKTFMVDFLAAEFSEYSKGLILNVKFIKMAQPPFAGVKHSDTYSSEKNNLFFTPQNRFKAFKFFIKHLNSLNLTSKERIDVSTEILKQLYQQSTEGYILTLNNKAICDWYNVAESFKTREFKRDLEEDFHNNLEKFSEFKTEEERKIILKNFQKYLKRIKFKKLKKEIISKISQSNFNYFEKFLKHYFHKKRVSIKFKNGDINFLWRELNKHNETTISNHVNPEQVFVGNYTYGHIDMYHSGNGNEILNIGNYCSIAPNVTFLLATEHDYKGLSTFPFKVKFFGEENEAESKGSITVEDDVWIGYGAIILSGVTIKQGAVIGAGSVVTKDVPPYAIVAGNPARVLKYRFSEEIIEKLLKIDYSKLKKDKIKKLSKDLYRDITPENADEIVDKIIKLYQKTK